ncbi:hypothetical protein NFJ02_43g110250 [Pycnococcus provasolii]
MGCGASSLPLTFESPSAHKPLPVSFGPQFKLPAAANLNVREKLFSWSGDDIDIKDINTGTTWFKINAKVFSLKGNKKLLDAAGQEVLQIESKLLSLRATYHMYTPAGARVATIVKRAMAMKPTYLVYLWPPEMGLTRDSPTSFDNHKPAMFVQGGLFEVEWKFILGSDESQGGGRVDTSTMPVCGLANHDWTNFQDLVIDRQMFNLMIMPGVDVAFAVALLVIIQEQEESERGSGPALM